MCVCVCVCVCADDMHEECLSSCMNVRHGHLSNSMRPDKVGSAGGDGT